MKILKRVLFSVFFLFAVDLLVSFVWFMSVTADEKTEYLERAELAIVLMGDVNENFTDIGPKTRQRLDHALKLQEQGFFDRYLCVGGHRPNRHFSGAQMMKEYLLRNGVKEENIFLEPHSYDTKTNLRYTAPILRNNKWYSVILISSPLHIHRIKKMRESKYFQGRIVQWAPHPYSKPNSKLDLAEIWKDIHYEWTSYAVGLLPYPVYSRIVHFVREQK
ncbi:MAG: YdcF family protein [Candidatus Omnitrophota bacterium]